MPPKWILDLGINVAHISHSSSVTEHGRTFVIEPVPGDQIWRILLDSGWLKGSFRKADYLFWGKNSQGKCVMIIVELKGVDYGHALSQIANTLAILCKHSDTNIVHVGYHRNGPGHALTSERGVKAYVILSNSRQVPLKLKEREAIRQKYNVVVVAKSRELRVRGINNLPNH